MAAKKIIVVFLLISALNKFVPTESAWVPVNDGGIIGETTNAIQGLFNLNPLQHYPGRPENYPQNQGGYHHSSGGGGYYPPNQPYPNYPHSQPYPNYPHNQPYPNYPPGRTHGYYPSGPGAGYPGGDGRSGTRYPHEQGSYIPNSPPGYVPPTQESNYPGQATGVRQPNTDYTSERRYPASDPNLNVRDENSKSTFPPFITSNKITPPSSEATIDNSVNNPPVGSGTEDKSRNSITNYEVDLRNGGNEPTSSPPESTTKILVQDGRSLLAFKGCPEGERKDRAGKCRPIS